MIDARILDAAQQVITEAGVQQVTIERIAQVAGLSRTTLHRRGKEQIIDALFVRVADRYRTAMWRVLTAPGSAIERLQEAVKVLCDQVEANLALLLGMQTSLEAYFHDDETSTRSVFTEPLERLLRDGLAEGSIRDLDPAETATVLFHSVGWTYLHVRASHRWRKERAQTNAVNLALYGVVNCGREDQTA